MDVAAVNRSAWLVLLEDDTTAPILAFYKAGACECDHDDPEAICCVAGDDSMGYWSVRLGDFEAAVVH